MTEQEFRRQVAELGFTISMETSYPTVKETSIHYPFYSCVFLGKSNPHPIVAGGNNVVHPSVISALQEWEVLTGRTILDPIITAARLAEKKP